MIHPLRELVACASVEQWGVWDERSPPTQIWYSLTLTIPCVGARVPVAWPPLWSRWYCSGVEEFVSHQVCAEEAGESCTEGIDQCECSFCKPGISVSHRPSRLSCSAAWVFVCSASALS